MIRALVSMKPILMIAIILNVALAAFAQSRGTIAYVRDGVEIRAVEPDGANDRRLWTHPDAKKPLGIDSLAWSPDGKEIALLKPPHCPSVAVRR